MVSSKWSVLYFRPVQAEVDGLPGKEVVALGACQGEAHHVVGELFFLQDGNGKFHGIGSLVGMLLKLTPM